MFVYVRVSGVCIFSLVYVCLCMCVSERDCVCVCVCVCAFVITFKRGHFQ